jgi:nucleoside-diphosphate-sugar epimerase
MRGVALPRPPTGVDRENSSTPTARVASLGDQHVVVLGGGGFIGSAITRALVAYAGRLSTILGLPGAAVVPAPRDVQSGYLDICDMQGLVYWLREVDTVIYAAGPPSVAASFGNPVPFAQVHVVGTVSTLEACRRARVRRLVYLSSAEVYGQPDVNPVAEGAPLAPLSPYGAAKMSAETFICADAGRSVGDAIILRPFSVYGPGSPAGSLVGSIIRQVLTGSEIRVFDSRPVRDYCYIEDLVTCVLEACASPVDAPVRIYNVGSGRATSIADLTRRALEIAGRDLPVRIAAEPDRPPHAAVRKLIADVDKAKRELRWSCSTALEQGLAYVIAHIREYQS